MGSLLGNYVHLTPSNYLKAGTFRNERNWNTSRQQASDFNPSIFIQQKNKIRSKYSWIEQENQKIKAMEKHYNNERNALYEKFLELGRTSPEMQKLFEKVIINARLGDSINIQQLASLLDFEIATQSINLEEKVLIQQAQKIKSGRGKIFVRNSTVEDRAKIANNRIDAISDQTLKATLEKAYKLVLADFNTAKEGVAGLYAIEQKLGLKNVTNRTAYKHSLPADIANALIAQFDYVTSIAMTTSQLIKLKASFAEVMGALLREQGALGKTIDQALDDLENSLLSRTSTMSNISISIIDTDQKYMKKKYDLQKGGEQFKTIQEVKIHNGKKEKTMYTFKVNFQSFNKADFIFEYNGNPFGVSMKNTDMTKEYFENIDGEKIPTTISLHSGTSLLVFLSAMENNTNNIHNHFLNVFAQPPSAFSRLRQQAADVLLVSLLYTGLSGYGLGKTLGTADIFAIEDKGATNNLQRVRFYSLGQIISYVSNSHERLINSLEFEPDFYTFVLNNKYMHGDNKQQAIKTRLTRVLDHARSIPLALSIRKNILNKLYK